MFDNLQGARYECSRKNCESRFFKFSISDFYFQLIKPLESAKKEAQYLFARKSTGVIVNMLRKAGIFNVLCVGAPRIHEHIRSAFSSDMSSMLLDFDHRYVGDFLCLKDLGHTLTFILRLMSVFCYFSASFTKSQSFHGLMPLTATGYLKMWEKMQPYSSWAKQRVRSWF